MHQPRQLLRLLPARRVLLVLRSFELLLRPRRLLLLWRARELLRLLRARRLLRGLWGWQLQQLLPAVQRLLHVRSVLLLQRVLGPLRSGLLLPLRLLRRVQLLLWERRDELWLAGRGVLRVGVAAHVLRVHQDQPNAQGARARH